MKKLLVVLLALTFVFVMASVTLAVVTSSVDGKVEWTLDNTNQMGGSVDGKIIFDLGKDYGEGYSAGLKIKLDPTNDNNSDELKFDGDGWIKMVKDFGTFTFQTGGLGGNAANDLGGQCDMIGNPGIKFESTSLVEGLNLTVVVNENQIMNGTADLGEFYNYLIKGVYTADALTIGAGYQAHTVPDLNKANNLKDAMAVWAAYKIGDSVTVGAEYSSRPNVTNPFNSTKGATSMMVKASYVADALTVNGSYTSKTYGYFTKETAKYGADADKYSEAEIFEYLPIIEGSLIKVDATYKISDAFSVNGNVQILGGKMAGADITTDTMSYKLGATYQVSEKLGTEAWYKSIGDTSPLPATELGVKATYTFIAGLVGTLELKSASTATATQATDSYTVKLTATL